MKRLKKQSKLVTVLALIASTCLPLHGAMASTQPLDLQQLLAGKTYGNIPAPDDYTSGDGIINLKKGQPIAEGLPLAASKLDKLSVQSALKAAGINLDLSKTPLTELKFLNKVSVTELVGADSALKDIKAEAIGWLNQGAKTLGEIAGTPAGLSPLPDEVLKNTPISELGNISQIPFSSLPTAANLPITQFPGLADVPIAQTIPNLPAMSTNAPLPTGVYFIKLDKVRTREKGNGINPKVLTGSDQQPKAQWTSADPINVAEFRDAINGSKTNLINGGLMVDGSRQMIPGGNLPSPFQPTALPIYGTNLAVSIHSIDARKGTARLQLNARLEYMFGLRTSYFIPIPIPVTLSEKGNTLIPFPLEIQPPAPRQLANFDAKAATPIAQASVAGAAATRPNLPAASVVDAYALNIANGNIGPAVKTNATNPAIGF